MCDESAFIDTVFVFVLDGMFCIATNRNETSEKKFEAQKNTAKQNKTKH